MSLNENEYRYRFCCGSFHAERGAFVIAIGGMALTSLGLFGGFAEMNLVDVVISLLFMAVCVAIFFAQRRNEPRLYLPFLGLVGFYTLSAIIFSVFLIFMAAFHPLFIERIINIYDKSYWKFTFAFSDDSDAKIAEIRIAALMMAITLSTLAAFYSFLWRIVFLAYEYMNLGLSTLGANPTYPHYNEV